MAETAPTDLFDLAVSRLRWLDQRASLLAQNVANVDTPGWRPRDLAPFGQALRLAEVEPVRTSAMHLSGTTGAVAGVKVQQDGERAPDGNAVRLDEELAKLADTETAQTLVTNLYSKYLGLFRTALGR